MFEEQLAEKDKALAELKGPLQEKIANQTEQLTLGISRYSSENERLKKENPAN